MKQIRVFNEIGKLKKVMLHRPGNELLNLTPTKLAELLFDDIPYLALAQKEHDEFAKKLEENGVEVVYIEDLMTEVFEQNPEIIKKFIYQWCNEGGVKTTKWHNKICNYLISNFHGKDLVLKTIEGITLREIGASLDSLDDLVSEPTELIIPPMPNLYFQRDPFASIGNGISLNNMCFETRKRETIYAEYIFRYHKDYKNDIPFYSDRFSNFTIEGGDIIVLSKNVIAVGISQRTSPNAIEDLARNIFNDANSEIKTVLAFRIPSTRAYMHLDTVFTQVDFNKFLVYPGAMNQLKAFEIIKGSDDIKLSEIDLSLDEILKKYLHLDSVEIIECGGNDRIASEREQWNDGSNVLAIAPGKVIVYERNNVTNEVLKQHGVEIIEIPCAELSRGRGGPRCMSMPLIRE